MIDTFGKYTVQPVRLVSETEVEACEENEADFYSVYEKDSDGFSNCVADAENKKAAQYIAFCLFKGGSNPSSLIK